MKPQKIAVLGFAVDRQDFDYYTKDDTFPQIAAYKYERRLIEGIIANGVEVSVLASPAISTFPSNKKIIIFQRKSKDGCSPNKTFIPYINLPLLKLPTRLISTSLKLFKLGKRVQALYISSLHSPYLIAGLLYNFFFRVPYFVTILDLPEHMNFQKKGKLFRILKKIDHEIIKTCLSKAKGIVVTTKYIAEDSQDLRSKPFLVIEGVAEDQLQSQEPSKNKYRVRHKKPILYTGSTNEAHGVRQLVEGFLLNSDPTLALWICGTGDLDNYIRDKERQDSRIKYFGYISPEEVTQLQAASSLLIITRNPSMAYTRYSFPSKLLEYLASGVPVLTTKLPGIPDELIPYLNLIEDLTPEAINFSIQKVLEQNGASTWARSEAAKNYVLDQKNAKIQAKKLINFMSTNI